MADVESPKNDPAIPVVSYDGESMTRVSVSLTGSFTARNPEIVEYGFDLAEGSFSGGAAKTVLAERTEEGSFTSVATIEPGKHYVVKSWFSNGKQKKYSQEKAISAPLTSAATLTDVTYAGGRLTATVVDNGGRTINETGFCWGKTKDVREVKRSNKRQATLSGNTFSLDVAEFMPGETYYLLAYAENSEDASVDIYGYSRNLLELSVSYDDYVDIEDDNFESYLVANFDTDHNGWMSFGELAAITAIDVVTDKIVTVKEIDLMPDLKRLAVAGTAAQSGRLTKLDVSKNGKLTTIICDNNQLDSLGLAACPLLDTLSCAGNRIKELDVTGEKYLKSLKIGNNPLESEVDISYCESLTEFFVENCTMLKTIYVWLTFDETEYADFHKDPSAEYVIAPHINIPIPDANFKKYLVENFDLNGDEEISSMEATHIQSIDVITDDIVSIAGIEYFKNLTILICRGSSSHFSGGREHPVASGKLTSVNVAKNPKLTDLKLDCNQITKLDVSVNKTLVSLWCQANNLSELILPDTTVLTDIYCDHNLLESLDISKAIHLQNLQCYSNLLSSLDVSKNLDLIDLDCGWNYISAIDVSKQTKLKTLYCEANQLSFLDITNNNQLELLNCLSNRLSEIDVSKNSFLKQLSCQDNQLICLDISNNPLLSDVKCDNVNVPDANFKKYLVENYDKDGDGEISLAEASAATSIDVCTDGITTISGIESFPNLTFLSCSGRFEEDSDNYIGNLSKVDVSQNRKLVEIDLSRNNISALDFSSNNALKYISCYNNQLTSITLGDNTVLLSLGCGNNFLSCLDLSKNPNIVDIDCSDNQLTSMDVSNNPSLKTLLCENNVLETIILGNNTKLTTLQCHNNRLTTLDVSSCYSLSTLTCTNNQISTLDLKNNKVLETLQCSDNPLKAVDLSNNPLLATLRCWNNQLMTIDLLNNPKLIILDCNGNDLIALDVSNCSSLLRLNCSGNHISKLSCNTALTYLDCRSNQLTELDVSNISQLNWLECVGNQLTILDVSNNLLLKTLYCGANYSLAEIWFRNEAQRIALENFNYDTTIATIKYKE